MKKQILFTTLTIFALTSCSQNGTHEEVNTKETNELGVNIQIKASETRADNEKFKDKETVGVFIVGKKENTYTSKLATYTYDLINNSWTGPTEKEKKILLDFNEAEVYGYYPSTESLSIIDLGKKEMTCSIKSNQKFPTTDATDYMYSTSNIKPGTLPVVSTSNTSAGLLFRHALAKVSFAIYKADDYPSTTATLTKIRLYSGTDFFSTSGTLNLGNGNWTEKSTKVTELTLTGSNECNSGPKPIDPKETNRTAFGLFAPCNNVNTLSAEFTINSKPMSKTLTSSTVTKWEAGKEYIYTLTLSAKGLEITCAIEPWDMVEENLGNIE